MQHVRGALGGVRIVRHHDDGLLEFGVQPLQQRQHLRRRLRVEIARRLVGEQQRRDRSRWRGRSRRAAPGRRRAGADSACVRSPRPTMSSAVMHVIAPLLLRQTRQQERQLDVLERGEHRDQVVELKDEPDVARAPRRRAPASDRPLISVPPMRIEPLRRTIDAREQIQQRRLARSGRSHQAEEVALGTEMRDVDREPESRSCRAAVRLA